MIEKNYIGIAAIIGVACVGIVALIAIFTPENMDVAGWTVGALSLMGLGLGYLSSKTRVSDATDGADAGKR